MQDKLNNAKKEVRSVLITYQKGVPFDTFLKSYRGLLGQRLPSRDLGFSSDIDFLRAIPDVVHLSTNDFGKIMLTGIADETSQHIQKLVSKQRKCKPNNKSKKPISRNRPYGGFYARELSPFVPGVVRAEITELASMYPDGIGFGPFLMAYYKKYNKNLFLNKGFETLENMIKAMSNLEIRTIRNEKRIFPKNVINSNLLKEPFKDQKNGMSARQGEVYRHQLNGQSSNSTSIDKSGVSEAVQKNFQLVLDKCPEGILAPHFPPLYEKLTREAFDLFEMGYNSILDLVDALPWIFQRVLDPSDNKNWIILSSNASTKRFRDERQKISELTTSSASNQKELSHMKVCEGIPPGAASPFIPYKQPVMPENINMDEYLPTFVSAIVNPGMFWFQLQTDEEIKKFEQLEKDLGFFYDQYDSFKMSDAHIVPNASCVFRCPVDKQWYRAIIKSVPTADLVNVFYLDYGSRENVSKSELRYARSKYMDYPAHAFKARLAGLKPPNNASSWDTRSQQRFIELCESASIMAYLKPMDNDTYSTYLCDTSGDDDVHVNETLVSEGYAEFSSEYQMSRNENSSEFSDSTASNGIHSDAELCSTPKSSLQSSLLDKPDINFSENKKCSPVKPTQKNDKSDLAVNRKLSYSVENHYNGVEQVTSSYKEHPKRYIKLSQTNDDWKIFIINFKNKPYASALEVTKLLWKDKDSTYLAERLKYKEVDVPTVKVSKEDYPELFKQCEWFKLPDLEVNSDSLTLYPLTWAFNILNIFGHLSASLRIILKCEIEHFDPLDPIWKEFCFENLDVDQEFEKLSNLCLYDLKAKYEALSIKRLKLEKSKNMSAVNEIQKTKQLQNIIEKRMKFIEATCSMYPNYS